MGNLIISFSGRRDGNCDQIAGYIASDLDRTVYFRQMNVHPCSGCSYECFDGVCKYREDDIYGLYDEMSRCDKVVLIVPMYCGNPASLYFIFNERGQDYFFHNEDRYEEIIRRLYIIGIYGEKESTPDFVPCLQKWFSGLNCCDRVLGLERHIYGQKLHDNILDADGVVEKIERFLNGK